MEKPLGKYRNRKSAIFSYIATLLEAADERSSSSVSKKILARTQLILLRPIFKFIFGRDIWRFHLELLREKSEAESFLKMQVGEKGIWDLYFCSLDELYSLREVLSVLKEPPGVIADLGCGLGRSTVFLAQMLGWQSSRFMLIDGTIEISTDKPARVGEFQTGYHESINLKESVYNSLPLTSAFLESNAIRNFETRPLDSFLQSNAKMVGRIDLLFSFQAVGYHWDIQAAISDLKILDLINENGILIFGIRNREKSVRQGVPYVIPVIQGFTLTKVIEGFHRQDFLVYRRT